MRILVIFILVFASFAAEAMVIRSKNDLWLWQTVFDRTAPLAWNWEEEADAVTVAVSNRLTGAVSFRAVVRKDGEARANCPPPTIPVTDEALLSVTVVQTANGVAVSRMSADLAYAPGAAGQPIVVRTKTRHDWYCVERPRLAAYDAAWWGVDGPSGCEVLWRRPSGWHRVERAFAGVGAVDEVLLRFGYTGFSILFR